MHCLNLHLSDYHWADDKLCPNSKSWDTAAQVEAPFAMFIPVPLSQQSLKPKHAGNEAAFSEQRNQPGG